MYEDRHTLPDLRWFWSITVYVNPKRGITTNGRTATLEQAQQNFRESWERVQVGVNPRITRLH
jgi:hypothetical protein